MSSSNQDTEELGKAIYRLLYADYLKKYIKEPLEETVKLLSDQYGLLSELTNVTLLLIFTHIDLLGYLYTGSSKAKNAVTFFRDYFGKIDARYKEVSGLLYDALRHGYVHLGTPKRILLADGKILDFSFAAFGNKRDYLIIKKARETEQGEWVEIHRLLVDVTQLYEDLLSAIDLYAEDISHNQELSNNFWKNFKTRRRTEKTTESELLKKSYIRQSDFYFIRKQI